jgi:hypothetical protein
VPQPLDDYLRQFGHIEIYNYGEMVIILNSSVSESTVSSISENVSVLVSTDKQDMAQAIRELTEAVADAQELVLGQREELLDQIKELAHQATLSPSQRAGTGVIRALIGAIATTIATAGGLAEVWGTWGQQITEFFGL